jgi:RNA polymerase sigma-70 factor (ECF subfamily)
MAEITDEQLIDQYRDTGEMRWFNDLVTRHVGRIRAMVYPMVLNDADADELTQEIFMRVVKGLAGFSGKARFSSWLYRIAVNTANSFLRKRGTSPIEHRSEPPDRADGSGGPAENLSAVEMDGRIEKAMAGLSPSLRGAITLTAIQGMSVRDAARAQGCLRATMYWRVHAARRILKAKLNIEGQP